MGAQLDFMVREEGGRVRGYGSVAERLLNEHNLKLNALRTNDVLSYDDWKQIDDAMLKAAKDRLVGVSDLMGRGLTFNLTDPLGTMLFGSQKLGEMGSASVDMDGETEGPYDRQTIGIDYVPIPIIHQSFRLNIRHLRASRKSGEPLDTTGIEEATLNVLDKMDTMLFTGDSNLAYAGGTIYGYEDFPYINTVAIGQNWDASGDMGEYILQKVIAMKQASIEAKHYGPFVLYIPTEYDALLDDDYSEAKGDLTIRERIKKIDRIEDVRVADKMTDNKVLLVEMSTSTVRWIVGSNPMPVEWETKGGMVMHFKVMAIGAPQIRADKSNRCGVTLLSA